MLRAMPHRVGDRLVGFWTEDHGLSVFTVVLLVEIFVVTPLSPRGGHAQVSDVAYAALLLSGVYALAQGHWSRLVLVPVAALALAIAFARWFTRVPEPLVLASGLLLLLLYLGVVLGHTLRAGPVTAHRLHGGVAAYLLLGLIWAYAYRLLEILRPGAFSGVGAGETAALTYYSFVTLTTMGYGDVLPVHPLARSLATLEAVVGVLYVAILVSRLVSLAMVEARRDEAS
jgi:hypothetical protein